MQIGTVKLDELKSLNTIYGNTYIDTHGYRRISGTDKLLHRLIAEAYFGKWISDPNDYYIIHHIDGNKLNNCVLNLEPLKSSDHQRIHFKNYVHSEKSIKRISEALKRIPHELTHNISISKTRNSTNYFRVTIEKNPKLKQGFYYRYQYYDENGKHHRLNSVDINKLEKKVKNKGLEWLEYENTDN